MIVMMVIIRSDDYQHCTITIENYNYHHLNYYSDSYNQWFLLKVILD